MLIHAYSFALLFAPPVGLVALVWSRDPETSLSAVAVAAALALTIGAIQQWNVNLAVAQGRIDRARFVPWRPTTTIDSVPAVPSPNTLEQPLHASRSVVLNANGQTGQLSLYPASNELVEFLEACIRLSSADSLRFPPVLDLKHIGIPYEQQDAMFALLGDAVIRKGRRPTLIKNGFNLGDLRRMAAGG